MGEEHSAYVEVYNYYREIFDELLEEFNAEALEPDVFFAEYGIASVFDEKMMQMDEYARLAQHFMDDVYNSGEGNEEGWEIWTLKVSRLGSEKIDELEEAFETMISY